MSQGSCFVHLKKTPAKEISSLFEVDFWWERFEPSNVVTVVYTGNWMQGGGVFTAKQLAESCL
jgi:hypothetical protein